MAHIEIKSHGIFGTVFVDGKEINDVRKVSYELSIDGSTPVVELELLATDIAIDAKGVIPELPDVFKPFYKKIEPTGR
jgi:hypothetical protein